MIPSVPLTRSWQPDALLDRASDWRDLSNQLEARVYRYRNIIDELTASWVGEASRAATTLATAIAAHTAAVESGVRQIAAAAEDARDLLTSGRTAVLCTIDAAEGAGFHVSDAGVATASTEQRTAAALADDVDAAHADLADQERRWSAEISAALDRLAQLDRMAAALLHRAADLLPTRHSEDSPQPMTPDERRLWWESLSDSRKRELLEQHPELLGGLDGLPARVRDEANRARINGLVAALEVGLAGHRAALFRLDASDPGGSDGPPTMVARRELLDRIAEAEMRLRDLDAVRSALAGDDRLLLLLDTESAGQTRAAMALGDPDTADHVSVTTGGITTTVHGSLAGMVTEAGQLRQEAMSQLRDSDRETESVSVIAWLGYDAPQIADGGPGVVDILTRDHAERGAADLSAFFRGLDAANGQRDANVSAFGHSYGSLTTSLALQHEPEHGVDTAVFYGSPGIAVDNSPIGERSIADQLGVGAVHEMTGGRDAVAHLPWFGTNPYELDGVERLSTDPVVTPDGIARDGAEGHSDYARAGDNGQLRVSGYNLAAILADTGNEVPHTRTWLR